MTEEQTEKSNFSKKVEDIKKLSELGIPTLISLAVTALVMWYGIKVFPDYLDRQAKSSEKMAETSEKMQATNAEIQHSMEEIEQSTADIKKAAEETVEVERETKIFMEGVQRDHKECLEDHARQDSALAEILKEVKK